MKRLLVLTMVLAVVSVASATVGLDVYVNGTIGSTVNPGDIVTLQFTDTPAAAFSGVSAILIDVDYGDFTSYWVLPGGFMNTLAQANVGDGFTVTGSYSGFNLWNPGDGIIFTTIFGVPTDITAGGINITLGGAINVQAIAGFSTTLEVVPEPMTMALLGLGGLFLRRRRA